jgi:hypothetical protein
MRASVCEDQRDCIVIYEGNKCPMCASQKTLDESQNELSDAQDKIEELTKQ